MDKNKILVLSDIGNMSDSILKNSVCLAKIINADIELFYVKKPTEVVVAENQFSAMRVINQDYNTVDKAIKAYINPIYEEFGVNITYSFSYGNVKNEISSYIEDCQPDVIVIGKRKPKAINFVGNNITDYVLKKHNGLLMITAENNPLEPNEELTLGVLNSDEETTNVSFAEGFLPYTSRKITSFRISKKTAKTEQTYTHSNKQIEECVFDKNKNVVNNLSNYLVKNKINLFCIDREKSIKKTKSLFAKEDIKRMINKINVTILLTKSNNPLSL
ncbi:universal stress protein [Winogradskyella eckloniae]|uniref:universal stress protein n=1 Tax=Winogradskyella eckloniae TaxID=1089306 RepID=UPI0015669CCB|nr:universal stress protein [Winogradskyella eckloniae]NRD18807.1 universal stress protein [Winogradskyella eckloniae]